MTFQGLILKLQEFWASRGCTLQQPLDVEVGAGTMHPETFLPVLGPAHWNVPYVHPPPRPAGAAGAGGGGGGGAPRGLCGGRPARPHSAGPPRPPAPPPADGRFGEN